VILAIGNELRGDDGLGPKFAGDLSSKIQKYAFKNDKIVIIDGGTVPENFTGTIRKENPSHIIIVDAVEMEKEPGALELIDNDKIAQYNVSTHAMPLSFLIKYLETTGSFKILLLGVQPKNMELAEDLSPEVKESIHELVNVFLDIMNNSKIFD
jgi:hydrogenase 3 maturation protease